jgi:hypothetical protein
MAQDTRRDDMPNRSSNMEQAEGSRENVRSGDNSGGITNRPLEREQQEQERLPDRGQAKSDQSGEER